MVYMSHEATGKDRRHDKLMVYMSHEATGRQKAGFHVVMKSVYKRSITVTEWLD